MAILTTQNCTLAYLTSHFRQFSKMVKNFIFDRYNTGYQVGKSKNNFCLKMPESKEHFGEKVASLNSLLSQTLGGGTTKLLELVNIC